MELHEVLFLYGFSLIPFGLFNILSLNLYEFGNEYIMEGKFDRVLMRPVAHCFRSFREFRHRVVPGNSSGLVVVVWVSRAAGIHWSGWTFCC